MADKYRKRPVVIEAIQFFDDVKVVSKISEFTSESASMISVSRSSADMDNPVLKIPTLEGEMTASVGDWIIKGVNGEFYPCKPDIFDKTYEALSINKKPEGQSIGNWYISGEIVFKENGYEICDVFDKNAGPLIVTAPKLYAILNEIVQCGLIAPTKENVIQSIKELLKEARGE